MQTQIQTLGTTRPLGTDPPGDFTPVPSTIIAAQFLVFIEIDKGEMVLIASNKAYEEATNPHRIHDSALSAKTYAH